MRRHTWLATLIILVLTLVACGPTKDSTADFALVDPIPGANLEPAWWAAVSTTIVTSPDQPATIEVTVPSDVLFAENSSVLAPAAQAELAAIAEDVMAGETAPIKIVGHTDGLGEGDYNIQLGLERAEAVAEALIEHGVAAEQIAASSEGEGALLCAETRPDGTDDPDCRARNRRVTITYTTQQIEQ